jgi:hypothetical protein
MANGKRITSVSILNRINNKDVTAEIITHDRHANNVVRGRGVVMERRLVAITAQSTRESVYIYLCDDVALEKGRSLSGHISR